MALSLAVLTPPIWLVGFASPQAEAERSVQQGVYTPEQAERGEVVYDEVCGQCHAPDYFNPFYMRGWEGQTLDVFLDQIRATMPEDNPGSLEPRQYADVIAYILRINSVPAGEVELEADEATLKAIRIEGPFEAGGSGS